MTSCISLGAAEGPGAMSRALVYAYGCGSPLSGLDHAQAEYERCTQMWDRLVELEHTIERELLYRAREDDARLAEIGTLIATLTARLADEPDDKAARTQRRELYREQRERLKAWRKDHKEVVREYEQRRQMAVKVTRQQTDAWWPNYNRVLQSYETGRAVARQTGRRLRPYDPERDDGVLAVQIQRTRSGLGAAPIELTDGSVSALQIGVDPIVGRRARVVEMRVDADGNAVRLPVWVHRPLPEACRVKSAQLVWRRRADRVVYTLCLTVSAPGPAISPAAPASCARLSFDWRPNGGLHVVSAEYQGAVRAWSLPARWMARMDLAERMQQQLDEALATGRERFGLAEQSYLKLFEILQARWPTLPVPLRAWYRETRRLWKSWSGLRAHALGDRRQHYRLIAREIVRLYPAIDLPELDLAQLAREDRGEEPNSWRHRAAIHTLRNEIIHQASKIGVPVLASGCVVNASKHEKTSAWRRRKDAKKAALDNAPASV